MVFDDFYNILLQEYSSDNYRSEIEVAKEEYFALSGVVHEDDILYEERINAFLDWYLFDRKLQKEDLTPVILFYNENINDFTEEEKVLYNEILQFISSLFLVKKCKSKDIYVKDLFSGKKYMVSDNYVSRVVNKGDIFQARLIPFKGNYEFSKGFCFHPPETRSYILSEIRKIRNMDKMQHDSFMMRLALMRLKVEEYPHVDIKYIYCRKPKIRF